MSFRDSVKKVVFSNKALNKMVPAYKRIRKEFRKYRHLFSNVWVYYIISFFESRGIIPISKPVILQFPINDICNSHCIMCNVWKNKKGFEISAIDVEKILADPLFGKIRHVSLNGGEPTLRNDLVEIVQACITKLPELSTIGLITNGIRNEKIIAQCIQLNELCIKNKKNFSVSVSLDGLGEIHDKNRGVTGNFAAVNTLLSELKLKNITHSIGFTITPINVYWTDDVLSFCKKNGIDSYEFRLGVDIKRIYNIGFEAANPYNENQKFHIAMFFDKLSHSEHSSFMRLAYKNIAEHFGVGKKRELPCIYWNKGVTLDSHAAISYCSTESDFFGNSMTESAITIFESNIDHRTSIINTKCESCYHHLDGNLTPAQELGEILLPYQNLLKTSKKIFPKMPHHRRFKYNKVTASEWKRVLITGWYGTETAGDKAILGELVYQIRKRSPNCEIIITSINPLVSYQTNKEIDGLHNSKIVFLEEAHKHSLIEECDAVIVGGGPLMDIPQLENIYKIFVTANKAGKERIIFGCGVGPVKSKNAHQIVQSILALATKGFFRDEESLEYYKSINTGIEFYSAYDPAFSYIARMKDILIDNKNSQKLVTLLRKQTIHYTDVLPDETNFDLKLIHLLDLLSEQYADIELQAMHMIWQGNDDRLYNRELMDGLGDQSNISLEREYLPINDLIKKISSAHIGVAMRYHAHIFFTALEIPYLSIDYTGQNQKISRLMKKIRMQEFTINWYSLNAIDANEKISQIESNYQDIRNNFSLQTKIILDQLNDCYQKMFN